MRVSGWMVNAAGEPMVLTERDNRLVPGDAIVEVAGCGVCHTDLGFFYDGVPTRHHFPIVLGHEISGAICPEQVFPGSDIHGGFATHVRVPLHGLCVVPNLDDPAVNTTGLSLPDLAVIADAVSTPYQAILRSALGPGDLAVFVGVGGVGGLGVQIAAAMGAAVVAIDVNDARLESLSRCGASLTLRADVLDAKALRAKVRAFAGERRIPTWH